MKIGDLVKHKNYPYVGIILRKAKTSIRVAWIVLRHGSTNDGHSQRIRCWWADDLEVINENR
jgi:hypothetical protein